MTNATTTESRVKKIIREQMATYGARVDEMPNDYTLDAAGFDSLDLTMVVMGIEEDFSIDVPDEIAWAAKTVQDLINAVTNAERNHANT
jgi:acyl carrier protein